MFENNKKRNGKEEENFIKIMRARGKSFAKADTAFCKLTDAEKILVNAYLNDPEGSMGNAVVRCGLADDMEEAVAIGIALLKNPLISQAIDEVKSLGGFTPMRVKEGMANIIDIAMRNGDLQTALAGLRQMGKYLGMENIAPKAVEERSPIEIKEMKERLSETIVDAVSEAEDFVKDLKANYMPEKKVFDYDYESDEEISEDMGFNEE